MNWMAAAYVTYLLACFGGKGRLHLQHHKSPFSVFEKEILKMSSLPATNSLSDSVYGCV
jgi:flagellar motor switch protein FliM